MPTCTARLPLPPVVKVVKSGAGICVNYLGTGRIYPGVDRLTADHSFLFSVKV
jgi:hypothetical protein